MDCAQHDKEGDFVPGRQDVQCLRTLKKGFTLKLGLFLIRQLQNFVSNLHTKIHFLYKKVPLYKHTWFALVCVQLNGTNSFADFNNTSNS